jgi:hypothetical protein
MTYSPLPGSGFLVLLVIASFGDALLAQTILPTADSSERADDRPYEMVWAHRVETAPPTVRFDQLDGWQMKIEGGAQATLQASRAQNVWDRPVARLRYRGEGKADTKPRILLVPPQPVALPEGADAADLWVYGNRWDWEHPPDTPPVGLVLHLRGGDDQARDVRVDNVRWKEWSRARRRHLRANFLRLR